MIRMLVGAILILTIACVAFLVMASFDKREQVVGWLVPEAGMAAAYATPGAVIRRVTVKPRQVVKEGDVIAFISSDVFGTNGSVAEEEYRQTQNQLEETTAQIEVSQQQMRNDIAKIDSQITAATLVADIIRRQLDILARQISIANAQVERVKPLVERGFISGIESDRRLQAYLTLRQTANDYDRQLRQTQSDIKNFQSQSKEAVVRQKVEESQLRATRANLKTNLSAYAAARTSTVRAPVSGSVAAVNLHDGETAANGTPVAMIATPGRLVAEMLVPTRAAGFLREGQDVNVMVDAFPFQRYGSISGRIVQISNSTAPSSLFAQGADSREPVYRIVVSMSRQYVTAYGNRLGLRPGMAITGQVITDRRTLAQWLLDPLFASQIKNDR